MINTAKAFLILLAFLLLSTYSKVIQAQTNLNDCAGMACENGFLSPDVWRGEWGKRKVSNSGAETYSNIQHGLDPEHHRIRHSSEGDLSAHQFSCDDISFTPPGKDISIQLGGDHGQYRYERLATSFLVEPGNTMLQIQFAVVLYDPPNDHDQAQKPKFQFEIRDQNDTTIPCGKYEVVADGNIPGFQNCGNIRYRDWTSASIDLRAYEGQVVTIEFSTFNCGKGANRHYALALFTIECLQSAITTASTFCPGVSNAIQLSAPPGFANYHWSTGQTGQTVSIPNPILGDTVSVSFLPYSSLDPRCLLTLDYVIPTELSMQMVDNVQFCDKSSVAVAPIVPLGFTNFIWSNGTTAPSLSISEPGTYTVTVTDGSGQCSLTDSVIALAIPLPKGTLAGDSVVCPENSARLTLTTEGASGAGLAYFSSTAGEIFQIPLVAGVATVDIIPANNLTVFVDSISIPSNQCPFDLSPGQIDVRVDWVDVEIEVETTIQCPGLSNAVLATKPLQGTAPYSYLWNLGQVGDHLEGLPAGVYAVTATDRYGCTYASSIMLEDPPRLLPNVEAYPTPCFSELNAGSVFVSSVANAQSGQLLFSVGSEDAPVPGKISGLIPGDHLVRIWDGLCHIDTLLFLEMPPEYWAELSQHPDTLHFGDSIQMEIITNIPPNQQNIQWDGAAIFNGPNDVQPWVRPFRSTEIEATIVTPKGCVVSARTVLKVIQDRPFYAPNVFSPNGDGNNDWFMIYPKPSIVKSIRQFSVFDRWGGEVWREDFLTSPVENAKGWDGNVRNKSCPISVYTWQAEVEFFDGSRQRYFGDVTLVR